MKFNMIFHTRVSKLFGAICRKTGIQTGRSKTLEEKKKVTVDNELTNFVENDILKIRNFTKI